MAHQRILILDFGSQVTQLIARRVREAQVYCEIHPHDVSEGFLRTFNAQGVILSGSPASTEIIIKGADRQRVGQIAAEIRAVRPPEPYKGKGIRYSDEKIVIKETKKK